jgi:mono/diheme cytochrome c family protein
MLLLVMLAWTGHQGGSLTHGEGFLTEGILEKETITEPQLNVKDINQAVVYKDLVQYTLNQKCVQCHGAEKQKGKLRLDDLTWIKAGGKNGNLINTTNPAQGELIKRILLDDIDEHHMPPKEKTQLTDAELVIFQWWINAGASFEKSVAAMTPDAKVIKALASFKEQNQGQVKTNIKTREPVEPLDKKLQEKLEKSGWVVSPVALDDNHIRLTGYNIEIPLKNALLAAAEISEHVIELKLSFTALKDNDLENLNKFINLEKLWLDHTGISDNALKQVMGLEYLEYLNIVGTKTTASGVKILMNQQRLKMIYLQGIKITNEERLSLESIKSNAKLYFGDSMKSVITDTIFAKKAE